MWRAIACVVGVGVGIKRTSSCVHSWWGGVWRFPVGWWMDALVLMSMMKGAGAEIARECFNLSGRRVKKGRMHVLIAIHFFL